MTSPLKLGGRGHLPVIQQTEAAECGLACLAMICPYYGHRIDLNTLRRRYPVSLKGVTLRGMIQVASHMQLACRPVRFELIDLNLFNCGGLKAFDRCRARALAGRRVCTQGRASAASVFNVLDTVARQRTFDHPDFGAFGYPRSFCDYQSFLYAARCRRGHCQR